MLCKLERGVKLSEVQELKLAIALHVRAIVTDGRTLGTVLEFGRTEDLPFTSLAKQVYDSILIKNTSLANKLNKYLSHPSSQCSLIREALSDMHHDQVRHLTLV